MNKRIPMIWMGWALLALGLAACTAGDGGSSGSAGGGSDAGGSTSDAGTSESMTITDADFEGEEDVLRQWGPEEMPDRFEQPTAFFLWRVDEMFRRSDADEDGKMALEEFGGEEFNFHRMDKNSDNYLTKREVIQDMVPKLRETGELP